jgi:hypothetical protein
MAASMLLKILVFYMQNNEYSSSSLYACDAWSFRVKDEYISRVFGKKGLIGKE